MNCAQKKLTLKKLPHNKYQREWTMNVIPKSLDAK